MHVNYKAYSVGYIPAIPYWLNGAAMIRSQDFGYRGVRKPHMKAWSLDTELKQQSGARILFCGARASS